MLVIVFHISIDFEDMQEDIIVELVNWGIAGVCIRVNVIHGLRADVAFVRGNSLCSPGEQVDNATSLRSLEGLGWGVVDVGGKVELGTRSNHISNI